MCRQLIRFSGIHRCRQTKFVVLTHQLYDSKFLTEKMNSWTIKKGIFHLRVIYNSLFNEANVKVSCLSEVIQKALHLSVNMSRKVKIA